MLDLAAKQAAKEAKRREAAERAEARRLMEESRHPMLEKNEDYYIGLGLLAASCFIDAHIPPRLREKFSGEYLSMTGLPAHPGDRGFTTADENQWGISMRIYFPRKVLEMLPGLGAFSESTDGSPPTSHAPSGAVVAKLC